MSKRLIAVDIEELSSILKNIEKGREELKAVLKPYKAKEESKTEKGGEKQ